VGLSRAAFLVLVPALAFAGARPIEVLGYSAGDDWLYWEEFGEANRRALVGWKPSDGVLERFDYVAKVNAPDPFASGEVQGIGLSALGELRALLVEAGRLPAPVDSSRRAALGLEVTQARGRAQVRRAGKVAATAVAACPTPGPSAELYELPSKTPALLVLFTCDAAAAVLPAPRVRRAMDLPALRRRIAPLEVESAGRLAREARARFPSYVDGPTRFARAARAYEAAGVLDPALLEPKVGLAALFALDEDRDEALRWLTLAFRENSARAAALVRGNPDFASLRGHPRFERLLSGAPK
jgi:hypothetical protein